MTPQEIFEFRLHRLNCVDLEITRYRDYEWKAISFHTAFFVAILYLLIDPHTRLYLINAIDSKLLIGLAISGYFIIACLQLIDIHLKLNKRRDKRTELLTDIERFPQKNKINGFFEGPAAFIIIGFIIWLLILFAFDLFLLYKNYEVVVIAIILSLIVIEEWVNTLQLS